MEPNKDGVKEMLMEMKKDPEEENMKWQVIGLMMRMDRGAYLNYYPETLNEKPIWSGSGKEVQPMDWELKPTSRRSKESGKAR
jgi:hypothetical protein